MNLALFCRFKGAREIRDHFCAKQSDLAGNANFIEYRLCGPGSVEADFMENLGASDIYKYGMEQRVAVPGKFPFISAKNWRRSHLSQFGNYLYLLFFKKMLILVVTSLTKIISVFAGCTQGANAIVKVLLANLREGESNGRQISV